MGITNPCQIDAMQGSNVPRNWWRVEMWDPANGDNKAVGEVKNRSYFGSTDIVSFTNSSSHSWDIYGRVTCTMGPWSQEKVVYFAVDNPFFGGCSFAVAPYSLDRLNDNEQDVSYNGKYGYWHIFGVKFYARAYDIAPNVYRFEFGIDAWQDSDSHYKPSQW